MSPFGVVCLGSPEDGFIDAGRVTPLGTGIGGAGTARTAPPRSVVRWGRSGAPRSSEPGVDFLTVPLPWVSTVHCELSRISDVAFRLRDLGSRNGTLIGGRPIDGETVLRPGDVFEVGRSFWTLRPLSLAQHEARALPPFCHVLDEVEEVVRSQLPALVWGEEGTGKAAIAKLIADRMRPGEPFVHVSVRGLDPDALQRALVEGPRGGPLVRAEPGVLYLSGVDELDDAAQQRLLGLVRGRRRIVSSSSVDLHSWVTSGRFNPELYRELAAVRLEVPALRHRPEDIPRIIRAVADTSGVHLRFRTQAFRWMLSFAWPFNRRQLTRVLGVLGALSHAERPVDLEDLRAAVVPARGGGGAAPTNLSSLLP